MAELNFIKRTWRLLTSMRFGLILLCILSAALAVATLVPGAGQGYGKMAWLVQVLGLDNIYRSFLFRLLFALLCVNLLACSINRLRMLKLTTFPSPQQIKKSNLEQLPLVHRFTLRAGDKPVEDLLADFFRRRRFSIRKFHEGATTWLYASRGSAGPWFSFGLHISLVLVVAGFAWGGVARSETRVVLPVGEQAEVVTGSHQSTGVDRFTIRLDDFTTLYDASGAIDNWVSRVTIINNGREVQRGEVMVNRPLNYRGYHLYQYSYGQALKVELADGAREAPRPAVLFPNRFYRLPGLEQYGVWFGSWSENGRVDYALYQGHQQVSAGTLTTGESLTLPGNSGTLHLVGTSPFSVLLVKYDPSIPLVFASFVLVSLFFFLTLLVRHRRYWLRLEEADGLLTLVMGGVTSLHTRALDREEFEKMIREMEAYLGW
ncbi:cytochrome c biogenesis protein [Desulfofundulus australicus DSM 11792]|uniref:Cytochrome c biogenesis protein n=1 Tax=Desulfofundulus australicus DSM 11792 TaxID=1121425 RepID=A0A1M4TCH1_9FIRM|nr:cytochrome c biogenesis protein ResB [Desulfofundulus australicus]SHE42239.1 cytochrome c biogenesis protein [Desulfofundulus australicus DSM 11792]